MAHRQNSSLRDKLFVAIPYVDDLKQRRSKDSDYAANFYKPFSGQRDGSGLSFEGYRRAIHLYGGEQAIVNELRSVATGFKNLRIKNLDVIATFRQRMKDEQYDSPVERTLNRTICAPVDAPEVISYQRARKYAKNYPQPEWIHATEDHPINTDGWRLSTVPLDRFLIENQIVQDPDFISGEFNQDSSTPSIQSVSSDSSSDNETQNSEDSDTDTIMPKNRAPATPARKSRGKRQSGSGVSADKRQSGSGVSSTPASTQERNSRGQFSKRNGKPRGANFAARQMLNTRVGSNGSPAPVKRKKQAMEDSTAVACLTDLQDRVTKGTMSGNQLLTYIEENVSEWIEAAKNETAKNDAKTPTSKHARIAEPDQYSLFNDFLLQRFTATLVDTNKNLTQEQLAVIRGGPISYNGEPWCVLGWKGRGIFIPMLGAPLVHDFIVQSILNTKAQFAWTIRDVRDFFQVADVLSTFQIDAAGVCYDRKVGGPCKTNVFLTVEQQGKLFAAIDTKCRVGADDQVTHDEIVGRFCAIAELYGKDYEWERVFTRSPEDIAARGAEIIADEVALEAILGPEDDWYFGDAEACQNARHSPAATEIDLGPSAV